MTDIATLSEAVDRFESEQDIEQLRHRFAHGIDRLDADEFRQIWDEEATLIEDGVVRRGIENVMTYLADLRRRYPIIHHYVVNDETRIGGDRATGLCDHDIVAQDDAGQAYLIAATVTDSFVRHEGRWCILHRAIEVTHILALDGVRIISAQRDW